MGTKSEQRVLRKKVLCSLLTAGVFIVTLPICAYAAEQTLTGTQTVTTALNGNSKADNLTITGFNGSVQSVQSFKAVTIKDGSVITFGSSMIGIADTVTADETTNVTVNGTIQANFGQTINLNGTNTIGTINAVCSQDQPANITVGSNTTKTVVNGGIASGNNAGSINVILGTADSKVTDIVGTEEGNNRIYLNVGSINIIGVQGSSVNTNRIYTKDSTNFTTGGTINIKGPGMTVDVTRKSNTTITMGKKYAVTACAGGTINLGAEGERLAKLTVSGEEAGLVALNTIGESCVNPIGINVVSDAVNVTSSDGIAVWAVADYNNTAINVPKINIVATDLTATGSQGAVVAQDGIVTIGAADNYANNVTLNAVDGNTGGYATVYVRGYGTDKNAGAVSIYSHNISVNAPTGGEALSGNGGGHEKITLNGDSKVNINGSIETISTAENSSGKSSMMVNINQDVATPGVVAVVGKEISTLDKSQVNIKGGTGSSLTTDLKAGMAGKSAGGTINLTLGDGSTVTGNITAVNGGIATVTGSDGGLALNGAISADAGVINLSGKTTFAADKVSFTSANSGAINLIGGAMDGVLKIDTGAVNVAGAALTTHDFSKITPEKGLVLNSGSLTTTSGLIFANGIDTTSDDTVLASKDSGAISNTKVALNSGSLILDDSKYSVDYVSTASAALKNAGSTTLTMAGTLVNGTTAVTTITPEAASAIGNNVALDKVTVKNDGNNLVVGTSTTPSTTTEDGVTVGSTTTVAENGFGAKALDLGSGSTGAIITNGQNVTLGGSEGGDVLLADGKTDSNLKLVVGANELLGDATNTTGSLTLGNALVTKDTTLNLTGSVTINNGSSLTVNGNTTVTDGISAGGGNIAVGTGTLNSSLELTGGNNTLTGTANLSSLTSTPDAVLEIGTTGATSQVSIANANLNGATLIFDPAWTEPAAQNAISYSGDIDSLTAIGSNEYVTIGSTDTTEAATMFANTGLTFGEGNVESVLYLKGNQTLSGTSGSLTVNGTTASAAGNFTANANSLTMVDGSATVSGTAALSGVTSTSISDSAKLYINSATTGNTYTILAGSGITQGWTNANILTNNKLVSFTGTVSDTSFIVNSTVNSVADVFGGAIIAPNVVNDALGTSGTAAYAFLNKTVDSNVYSTAAGTVNAINSLANLGELGGVQHGAYTVGNTFADMVNDHLSFAGHDRAEHDVWAQYIHNKETVSNMSLGGLEGSYDLKYNGVVVGSDLYIRNNTTAGVAVMYADGDINGAMTKNDAKYYGVSLYGRQTNGRTNILADVTYMHGTNDLKQTNTGTEITASPKIDTFSLGVKAEQRYSKGNTSIVPYVGARYLHIGAAKYTNNLGFNYDPEDQNLFLIPIGVKVFGEIKANDWTFRPKAQLGYVWTLGNRNPSQTISYNGVNDEFSYNTADSGYFLGGLGFEAEHKNVAYALNYQYKKGSSTKNNIWMAQVRFAF